MMENPYVLEWTMKEKAKELTRMASMRRTASMTARPASARRVAGAALVRFGLFLNGGAYRCPGPPVTE